MLKDDDKTDHIETETAWVTKESDKAELQAVQKVQLQWSKAA